MNQQETEKENDKSGQENKNQKKLTNKCKLPGHGNHDWEHCFNNPNSKHFKGNVRNYKDDEKEK